MEEINCPNIEVCKLVTVEGFLNDEELRLEYINTFCKSGEIMWRNCTRYIIKKEINFCPDFVVPDSVMTSDHAIDRFDRENQ